MIKIDRTELIALGVLFALVASSALIPALFLKIRSDAVDQLSEVQDTLSQLQARAKPKSELSIHSAETSAPAAAFLDAATVGLAGAQLQAYLADLASEEHAQIVSSGIKSTDRDDAPDTIRIEASFDVTLKVLQTILYKLETGKPYVFVEILTVKPSATPGRRTVEDPLLRVNLDLHALWHRKSA